MHTDQKNSTSLTSGKALLTLIPTKVDEIVRTLNSTFDYNSLSGYKQDLDIMFNTAIAFCEEMEDKEGMHSIMNTFTELSSLMIVLYEIHVSNQKGGSHVH